jgi:hypothetical protein
VLAQIAEIFDTYAEQRPLTVRQLQYLLHAHYGYDASDRGYESLIYVTSRARRADLFPAEWLRDDGVVRREGPITFDGKEHYLDIVRGWTEDYRRDRREGQKVAIEVWCEHAGITPQLERVTDPYGVPVYSGGGFDSVSWKIESAERIATEWNDNGRPTVILHLGDHDGNGLTIFDCVAADVTAFANDRRGVPTSAVRFVRLAVTEVQKHRYSLPTRPATPKDREKGYTFDWTCKLEAFDPARLATVLRSAITTRTDSAVLREVVAQEAVERVSLLDLLAV